MFERKSCIVDKLLAKPFESEEPPLFLLFCVKRQENKTQLYLQSNFLDACSCCRESGHPSEL